MIKLLLTKPGDPLSESGRSMLRYQRAALTSFVMMAGRVVNILTGLLTVPITLNYLGEDLFGIWMVITGIVEFLSFSDFGIGIGLRNTLIECVGKDDTENPKKLIGNALFFLLTIAFFIILIAIFAFPFVPWEQFIKCKNPDSVPQILPTMQSVFCMFALGLPVAQLINISSAYQRGYWGYLCYFLGRVIGFFFVIWCVFTEQPLWLLAGGYLGFPHFTTLVGWGIYFKLVPFLRPWPFKADKQIIHRLFGIGFFVLLYHVSYAMIRASAVIIIANTINAASAVPYAITQKLLGVAGILTMSVLAGLSVAIGEAWHRKDTEWIKKTIRRSERITFFFGLLPLVVLMIVGRPLILFWTSSSESVPSFSLLLMCVLLSGGGMVGSIYSNGLMAMNFVRLVALTRCFFGIIVFFGGYYLGQLSQSPEIITFLQFFAGALIPAIIFRLKLNGLIEPVAKPIFNQIIHSLKYGTIKKL
ncbi:lipopolysaccharide biosynthesis protein [Aminivibrio sp.]|uniref:lipopolysaccharide biosynthesis protein n=1 Tax=Aminivibrio sp. TaxID=1872489 RepID=UPI003D961817